MRQKYGRRTKAPKEGDQGKVTRNLDILNSADQGSGWRAGNLDRLGKTGEVVNVDVKNRTVKMSWPKEKDWWVSIAALQGYEEYPAFVKGESVEIFSKSANQWLDGIIAQACQTDGEIDTPSGEKTVFKAGTLRVDYPGKNYSVRYKYVVPQYVSSMLRKARKQVSLLKNTKTWTVEAPDAVSGDVQGRAL